MTLSAYIHIPFCKSKCKYCSFVSYCSTDKNLFEEYVNALSKEIALMYKAEPLKTLYFGGGTPSLLEETTLAKIINLFNFDINPEITIEVNPETVNVKKLKMLREIGFNRLSMGVQSFDDNILKDIGRIHTAQKAVDAVNSARVAGFQNISLDFIYGLPNQSLQSFCSDLQKACALGVEHISLYGLKIEEGCYFDKHYPSNIADDDMQADMYLAAIELLKNNDFEHYEISNFCKIGCESKHNLNYWNVLPYYAFGAAAHGYQDIDGQLVRYQNYCDLSLYISKYDQKENLLSLSKQEALEECIFLGLRKRSGIDIDFLNKKFDIDFDNLYQATLNKYLQSGHILKTNEGYCLTNEGFLLSNVILAEFLV